MNIRKLLGNLTKRFWKIPKIQRFCIFLFTSLTITFLWVVPAFTQQPVTIRVMIQTLEGTQWNSIVEGFNDSQNNIRLQIVKGPNDTNLVEDLYTSAFLLGDAPYDLAYMDIVWVPKFAAAGWLQPLDKFVAASQVDLSEFLDGDINGGTYDGNLYRMPFRSDGGMLYYRTDLLEQGGYEPPETFAELMQISQDLQNQGIADWGYVWQGKQYEGMAAMFVEILAGHGAYWIDPDSREVGLDHPEAIAAAEFLYQTIQDGISPPGVTTYAEEETRRLFQNTNTVFLRNWPYVYPLAQDSEISNQFAIKPMVHSPQDDSGACQGGWGLGMVATTSHPDEAWEVMQYFSQPDVQRQFFLETGYVPARKSLFTDSELVAKYSHYPDLLNVVENSALRPPIAQYAQASDILQRYLSAVITGDMTPEAAMTAAARETRSVLGS